MTERVPGWQTGVAAPTQASGSGFPGQAGSSRCPPRSRSWPPRRRGGAGV